MSEALSVAQINLLKQNTSSTGFWDSFPALLAKLLIAVLVLVVIYYGWLFWKSGQNVKQATDLQDKMASERSTALGLQQRNEVLTRQNQLQQYGNLEAKHVYWSNLLPALASSTLQSATYNSLKASPDGTITLDVIVPNLQELDKYLQVFDLPLYDQNFSNVRISAYHKVESKAGSGLEFEVRFDFNPSLITYKQNQN